MPILDAPAALRYSDIQITPMNKVAQTASIYSNYQDRVDYGGEWWEMSIVLTFSEWDEGADVFAWANNLRLVDGIGRVEIPDTAPRRGTTTADSLTTTASASGTQREVQVGGLGAGKTLLRGSFIECPGNRLHTLLEDVTADGSGGATLTLFPRVRQVINAGSTLILGGAARPRGLWRLKAPPRLSWSAAEYGTHLAPESLSFVEALG